MYHQYRKTPHRARAVYLLSLVLALLCSTPAAADLKQAVRFQAMSGTLRQAGWNGTNTTGFYKKLVDQANSSGRGNMLHNRLKYYCEIIPACTTRDLYVIQIWGAGGRFNTTEMISGNSQYSPVYKQLHQQQIKGAYLVGFWDNYFARRDSNDTPQNPEEPWPSWHFVTGNPWTPGLTQLQAYINMIPKTSKLIIVGASLGGGTAATLASMLAQAQRPVEHLLVFDPAGIYGKRSEAIAHAVQPNVRRFFNIWQEKGCWPADYQGSGSFHVVNPHHTAAFQERFEGGRDGGPCVKSVSKSVHSDTWRHARKPGEHQRITHELLAAIDKATQPPPHIHQQRRIESSTVKLNTANGRHQDHVEFALSTTMDWWTGIRIFLANGTQYYIEREHGTGPYNVITNAIQRKRNSIAIPTAQLGSQIKIEFWTAKAFGVHTYMAETVINRDEATGRVVNVHWPRG